MNYKKFPYIKFTYEKGKYIVIINETEEPTIAKFNTNFSFQHCLEQWKLNRVQYEMEDKEAFKVKLHLYKTSNEAIKSGILVDCITVVEGKAIFYNPYSRELDEAASKYAKRHSSNEGVCSLLEKAYKEGARFKYKTIH
jgi:hypothetical protein